MLIPTGDYVVEVLDYKGEPVSGAMYMSASLRDASARAAPLAEAHGANRWRILRCIETSDDKQRWDVHTTV